MRLKLVGIPNPFRCVVGSTTVAVISSHAREFTVV
jgi:hypothetical protein